MKNYENQRENFSMLKNGVGIYTGQSLTPLPQSFQTIISGGALQCAGRLAMRVPPSAQKGFGGLLIVPLPVIVTIPCGFGA